MKRELEDVAELMQHIQSQLAVTDAVHTSMVSKSWLHAWSTIPTLRFHVRKEEYGKSMKLVDVHRTLITYNRDNIPIETFQLLIDIENQESASLVENWIKPVVTKPCLKELSLSLFLYATPFKLADEILSSVNLTKIRVSSPLRIHPVLMTTPLIKCVSLRELHLHGVRICEEALDDILSFCRLLVKIELLHSCKGFKTIKVKNLRYLYELTISEQHNGYGYGYGPSSTALEISHVPSLGVFSCNLPFPFNSHSISLGSSVTHLTLGGYGMVTGNACLKMIESGFHFLESLTLDDMTSWMSEKFHFTCASITRLSLQSCLSMLIDVQVHAPKLLFFSFDGGALPSLLFPVSNLEQIIVSLILHNPVDVNFFLELREALGLSNTCDIHITTDYNSTLPLDIDDLRTRLMLRPAVNVQQLRFGTIADQCLWERSPFFNAFFEICHPKYVYAEPDTCLRHNNHFCRMMLREVLEKKTTAPGYWAHYLEQLVLIRKPRYQKWEALTDSHTSFLDGSAPGVYLCFNLKWR